MNQKRAFTIEHFTMFRFGQATKI